MAPLSRSLAHATRVAFQSLTCHGPAAADVITDAPHGDSPSTAGRSSPTSAPSPAGGASTEPTAVDLSAPSPPASPSSPPTSPPSGHASPRPTSASESALTTRGASVGGSATPAGDRLPQSRMSEPPTAGSAEQQMLQLAKLVVGIGQAPPARVDTLLDRALEEAASVGDVLDAAVAPRRVSLAESEEVVALREEVERLNVELAEVKRTVAQEVELRENSDVLTIQASCDYDAARRELDAARLNLGRLRRENQDLAGHLSAANTAIATHDDVVRGLEASLRSADATSASALRLLEKERERFKAGIVAYTAQLDKLRAYYAARDSGQSGILPARERALLDENASLRRANMVLRQHSADHGLDVDSLLSSAAGISASEIDWELLGLSRQPPPLTYGHGVESESSDSGVESLAGGDVAMETTADDSLVAHASSGASSSEVPSSKRKRGSSRSAEPSPSSRSQLPPSKRLGRPSVDLKALAAAASGGSGSSPLPLQSRRPLPVRLLQLGDYPSSSQSSSPASSSPPSPDRGGLEGSPISLTGGSPAKLPATPSLRRGAGAHPGKVVGLSGEAHDYEAPGSGGDNEGSPKSGGDSGNDGVFLSPLVLPARRDGRPQRAASVSGRLRSMSSQELEDAPDELVLGLSGTGTSLSPPPAARRKSGSRHASPKKASPASRSSPTVKQASTDTSSTAHTGVQGLSAEASVTTPPATPTSRAAQGRTTETSSALVSLSSPRRPHVEITAIVSSVPGATPTAFDPLVGDAYTTYYSKKLSGIAVEMLSPGFECPGAPECWSQILNQSVPRVIPQDSFTPCSVDGIIAYGNWGDPDHPWTILRSKFPNDPCTFSLVGSVLGFRFRPDLWV